MYLFLADAVLLLHLAVVLFVVGGLVAVLVGNWRLTPGWRWVNTWGFRLLHAGAIGFVVVQAWLGEVCPLTVLESWLRREAGAAGYSGGFIEHWVHRVLFHDAPAWVFTVVYTLFGAAVAATWWRFPPRRWPPQAAKPAQQRSMQ
jgi:hypothetical protein